MARWLILMLVLMEGVAHAYISSKLQPLIFETIKYPETEPDLHTDTSHRSKRKIYQFEMHPHKMWPTTIQYKTDPDFTQEMKDTVAKILEDDFEARTCLTFVHTSNTPPLSEQYIYFRLGSEDNVCSTSVGMEHNTQTVHGQPIYLGRFCFNNRNGVLYTVASTLGMLNEANRPDRDDYVDIEWNHIRSEDRFNFAQHSSDYFDPNGIPYDYGSIMHMAPDRGLIEEERVNNLTALTMTPKNRRFIYVPGQTVELSFYDLFSINKVYCNASCRFGLTPPCEHGGYQDPSSCSNCICRDGYTGSRCEEIDSGSPGCSPSSGYRMVTEETSCLQSPGFGTRMPTRDGSWFTYQYGDRCSWQLNAPPGKLVDMWFEKVDLEGFRMSVYATCVHWVEIRYQGLEQARGIRYCQNVNRNRLLEDFVDEALIPYPNTDPLTSRSHQVMVMFKAPPYKPLDDLPSPAKELDGFNLCYKLSDKTIEDLEPEAPQPTIPQPTPAPRAESGEDGSDDTFLIIGAALGVLLLVLILLVCIVLVVVARKKRRKPQQVHDTSPGAGFHANTSTVIIHDSDINIAIAGKEREAAGGVAGLDDPLGPPSYKEHDPPPEYAVEDDGSDEKAAEAETEVHYDTPYAHGQNDQERPEGYENPTYVNS